MATITAPGIYDGLPAETYHSVCTPAPALSAGFAIKMIRKSPARAWFDSPINPAHAPEQKSAFDIGRAVHLLLLEPERFDAAVSVVRAFTKDGRPSEGYTTQDAKDQRAAAWAAGKVPLLPSELEMVQDMRRALRNQLPDLPFTTAPAFAGGAFDDARTELSYFWRHPRAGIWCKARADSLREPLLSRPGFIADLKATGIDDDGADRHAYNMSWHMRAAHYVDGYELLTGHRLPYWFISIETKPPHFVSVLTLDDESLAWGRAQNEKAAHTFARCLETGQWPSGRDRAGVLRLPEWALRQMDAAQAAGAYEPTFDEQKAAHRLAIAMQAPLSTAAE